MQNSRFSDAQVGAGVAKRDASAPEYGAPSAEALSRWENEGGAPDRRGETSNRKVVNASLPLSASQSAGHVVARHQKRSRVDPER